MDIRKESLKKHYEWNGKIEVVSRAKVTNREKLSGTLADAMKGADVFIGVSAPNCVTKEMVASMAEKS